MRPHSSPDADVGGSIDSVQRTTGIASELWKYALYQVDSDNLNENNCVHLHAQHSLAFAAFANANPILVFPDELPRFVSADPFVCLDIAALRGQAFAREKYVCDRARDRISSGGG